MALFLRQDDKRTELQQRVAAELQEKAKRKAELENQPRPDGVTDSNYMRDYTGSSRYLWLWVTIALVGLVGVTLFMAQA